jgi:hypothetical protein
MPRFYFHLRSPKGVEQDDTGLEFAGLEDAYLEACRTIPELSADFAREERNPARYAFEITDPAGSFLMDVPFTEVLDRGRKPVAPFTAARLQKAAAEVARTAYLINSIEEQRAALQITLAETRRLLAMSKQMRRA